LESPILNIQAQINILKTFFETLANKTWFKGAFIWKWYPNQQRSRGINNIDYTPQNKPLEIIIRKCF